MNFSNFVKKTRFQTSKITQKLKTSQDIQAILLLVFWTFGSRILGFVRSFLVLRMPTIDSEIFNSSFVLSEAITSFFILGSITVAILPQMIKLQENQKEERKEIEKFGLEKEFIKEIDQKVELETNQNLAENLESRKDKTAEFDKKVDEKDEDYYKKRENKKDFAMSFKTFEKQNVDGKKVEMNKKITENTEKRFILPELSSDPLKIKKFNKTAKLEQYETQNYTQNVDKNKKMDEKIHAKKVNLSDNSNSKSGESSQNPSQNNNSNPNSKIDKLSIYTNWCLLILGCFILILSLFGIIFIEPVLSIFNPSFFGKVQESGKLSQMLLLNQFLLFGPVLFAIKTILGVFLNIKKNYKIYSLEGVLANLGWIIALSVLYPIFGLVGAGFGMFLGFGITILLFGLHARKLGLCFNLGTFPELSNLLWQTFALYWPRLLIFSNTRLAEIIVAATSGNPNDPQITSVAMALNFQGIFIGVVLAIGTVFLPNLTEILVQSGKTKQFWKMLFDYLKINFFLAILGTIATIIGVPILLFLLSRLPFVSAKSVLSDPIAVNLIINLTFISSFSLIFQSIGEVLNRYFIAIERRWEPVIISIGGNFLAIQIALFFSKSWGSGGAAVGGFVLNTALFCFLSLYFVFQDWQNSINQKFNKPAQKS